MYYGYKWSEWFWKKQSDKKFYIILVKKLGGYGPKVGNLTL